MTQINIEFSFGENNSFQTGNAYFDFDITVQNTPGNFFDANNIGLINNAFACCFKEARLSSTGGSDLEHNKYAGQVSTIMQL